MTRRTPLLRVLTVIWAVVQLGAPALSALADGRLAAASVGERIAHVESSTSDRCPLVHPPECGICRYLSCAAPLPTDGSATAITVREVRVPRTQEGSSGRVALALPHGRAPPVA